MSSYGEAIREVMAGRLAPVYLLAGGDAFLEDFFIEKVVAQFLAPGSRKRVFSLDDDRAEDLLAELSAYTLFQGRQVLVARQAQRVSGKARDELLGYARSPNPEICLLLVIQEYQPTKALHRNLSKTATLVDTQPPLENKIRRWANYYTKLSGYTLQPEALDQLISIAGDSAGHVIGELKKIFTQLEDGQAVTAEMVAEQVGGGRVFDLWHLQQAVADKDTAQALQVLVSLLAYGTQPTRVVGALAALFMQLLFRQTRTTARGVYTGLNRQVTASVNGSMQRHYPLNETIHVLRLLLAADIGLKSSGGDGPQTLISLVATICRGVA